MGGGEREGEGEEEGENAKQDCFLSLTTHIIKLINGFLDSCDVIGQRDHPIFNIINQFNGLQRYPVPWRRGRGKGEGGEGGKGGEEGRCTQKYFHYSYRSEIDPYLTLHLRACGPTLHSEGNPLWG